MHRLAVWILEVPRTPYTRPLLCVFDTERQAQDCRAQLPFSERQHATIWEM